MVMRLWRKLTNADDGPEVLPDLDMLEADAYLGLRSSQRQPVQIGVDHSYITRPGEKKAIWLPITIVDLSTGGARVVSVDSLVSGDVARIEFKLPHGFGNWAGIGRITWVSPTGLLAGMAFNTPSSKKEQEALARLTKYVASTKSLTSRR
jgi:hypothetical protein